MSIKDIITVPNEILKKISEPIEKVGVNEKKLINDLFDTMYAFKGIGLAAVQIGILKRIIINDVPKKDEKSETLSSINPVIKKHSPNTSKPPNIIPVSLSMAVQTPKAQNITHMPCKVQLMKNFVLETFIRSNLPSPWRLTLTKRK